MYHKGIELLLANTNRMAGSVFDTSLDRLKYTVNITNVEEPIKMRPFRDLT